MFLLCVTCENRYIKLGTNEQCHLPISLISGQWPHCCMVNSYFSLHSRSYNASNQRNTMDACEAMCRFAVCGGASLHCLPCVSNGMHTVCTRTLVSQQPPHKRLEAKARARQSHLKHKLRSFRQMIHHHLHLLLLVSNPHCLQLSDVLWTCCKRVSCYGILARTARSQLGQ